MKRIEFHAEARTELIETARYYKAQQPGLGKRFLAAVRDGTQRIQTHPLLYRVVEEDSRGDLRQCRILRFPYGLIYRTKPDTIESIAVMHLHRRPGYWESRRGTD